MNTLYIILLSVSTFLFAVIGTALLVYFLPRFKLMDVPVERSNHTVPVPRGGGIAVTLSAAGFLLVSGANPVVGWMTIFLGAISLRDDIKSLSARARLIAQGIAVLYGLYSFGNVSFTSGLLPYWVEFPLAALFWMWFVNLYNFMDGIDGITSANTISLCAGVFALGMIHSNVSVGMMADSAVIAAAVLGFAVFNWSPARIFLGDVGSIPLGYMMGFLLLLLAAKGHLAAALILPAYYLSDATLTLARRALRGEKIWHAHSEHFYQKAVRSGMSHALVSKWIVALNITLIALAAASTLSTFVALVCLAIAYSASAVLLYKFSHNGNIPFNPSFGKRDTTRLLPENP